MTTITLGSNSRQQNKAIRARQTADNMAAHNAWQQACASVRQKHKGKADSELTELGLFPARPQS